MASVLLGKKDGSRLSEDVMLSIEDFTDRKPGSRVPGEGRVDRCPRCGRTGLWRQRHDGTLRIVHVQAAHLFGDGMRVEPEDCCTLPAHAARTLSA
jgi:hypothetical protein